MDRDHGWKQHRLFIVFAELSHSPEVSPKIVPIILVGLVLGRLYFGPYLRCSWFS